MARSCTECGDLRLKYKTTKGKRHRYFCSEEHALQYTARQMNRQQKLAKLTPKILKSNKYFNKSFYYEKVK